MILTEDERRAIEDGPRPPFRITAHWESLLSGSPDDPLRLQALPRTAEKRRWPGERPDPLGEENPGLPSQLIRAYRDRALVLITGECALYCRHCFRRRVAGSGTAPIDDAALEAVSDWLAAHREVRELLLSGGDPLTLDDRRLASVIDRLRRDRPDLVMRLATRMPVVEPSRITRRLARLLGRRRPLWVVVQVNHPRELVPEARRAFDRLQKSGLPILNQAVLLRGVNDDPAVLEDLSARLVSLSVKPYYLFQGDLAEGTGHFRLPLDEARRLVDELNRRSSGLGRPTFAVDLPGGGGKVPLGRDFVGGRESGGWILETPDGRHGLYPDPADPMNEERL